MSTPVLKTDKKAKERAYEMLTVYGKGKEQNRSVACAERSKPTHTGDVVYPDSVKNNKGLIIVCFCIDQTFVFLQEDQKKIFFV